MSKLALSFRLPKPSYLWSQLSPRQKPDPGLSKLIDHLAQIYRLGEIKNCYRAPYTNSLNFFVITPQGKFVVRRHNLSEAAVAYEHQILAYLNERSFPAPKMLLTEEGQGWVTVNETRYSLYEFVEGYSPTNFVWWPGARREIIAQCGRTLGKYHQVVADLRPTAYKWNGYRPTEHKRWREGEWFRQALAEIQGWLQNSKATGPFDDFARSHLDAFEAMLRLESVVETRSELSKLVIHGDYAPWNILFRIGRSPFILDFNESRLDLKVYDLMLATFWFAWRGDRLDLNRALALQQGYCETNQLQEIDLKLAGEIFQWIMVRSMTERLYHHYEGYRHIGKGSVVLADQYRMCVFAGQQSQQLTAGLRGKN
jgi:Ser/Thr protein kinase RdoA (MazF antagonist)